MKNRLVVYTLASLFLGFAVGYFARGLMWRYVWSVRSDSYFAELLTDKLELDEPQSREIAALLQDAAKRIDELRSEIRPRFEQLRQETRGKITGVLKPEQQEQFKQLSAEMEERKKSRWGDKNKGPFFPPF